LGTVLHGKAFFKNEISIHLQGNIASNYRETQEPAMILLLEMLKLSKDKDQAVGHPTKVFPLPHHRLDSNYIWSFWNAGKDFDKFVRF
jgi:hypothetical protein